MKKIIVILLMVLTCLPGCGKTQDNTGLNTSNPSSGSVPYQLQPPAKGDTIVTMKTSEGDISIRLFSKEAPKAVENFTGLSKKGYYNGLTFHRIINDFMIQGGDPLGTGRGGASIWQKPFEDEFSPNLYNFRGALSMANSGPNTNGSQFFIVQAKTVNDAAYGRAPRQFTAAEKDLYSKYGGTPWLDNMHTVFGQVYQGIDVVDKIAETASTNPNKKFTINAVDVAVAP